MDYKKIEQKNTISKISDSWDVKKFKPYFILRYGYLSDKINELFQEYTQESGSSDSIQIFTDEESGIDSTLTNINFALIDNPNIPNNDLPRQYQREEIGIITHEIVHTIIEIVISCHFGSLLNQKTEKSYSDLGEGFTLAFQSVFLDAKVHYSDHSYTPYLLIGKGYFKHISELLGEASSLGLKNKISEYSQKLKAKFFQIRDDKISGETKNNEVVTQFNFSELIPFLQEVDWQKVLVNIEIEYNDAVDHINQNQTDNLQYLNHPTLGYGYISDYLIVIDSSGNSGCVDTLAKLEEGLRLSKNF